MTRNQGNAVEQPAVEVADVVFGQQKFVSAVDVLVGLRSLPPSWVDAWRQGRIADLESALSVKPEKLSNAMTAFRRWVEASALVPAESMQVARTRDRRTLRFSARRAGTRGSGRVGCSAAGRALDPGAVTLVVAASVRHEDTNYDELLMSGQVTIQVGS